MRNRHNESHKIKNINWLRAAVLGANDGIVSTASLVLGVAAAHPDRSAIVVAGVAGLVAGAMSMATGEYVSVSSQADSERAALDGERLELAKDPKSEQRELAGMYVGRGLAPSLAGQVADRLMEEDALGAHARDELGLSEVTKAKPIQAAIASACSFAAGAALPLAVAALIQIQYVVPAVAGSALAALALLGGLAANIGGAKLSPAVFRVTFWSALAMAVTFGVGALFNTPSS